MISTTPLLSTRAVPRIAKISLAGLIGFLVMPVAYGSALDVQGFNLDYVLLVVGEALLGVLTGFFISIIFASFSTAGQFFSYQMGFGVSEVYDALAQIENPLMGQFLNFIANPVFRRRTPQLSVYQLFYVPAKTGVTRLIFDNEPEYAFFKCDDDCDAGDGNAFFSTRVDGVAIKGCAADEPFIRRLSDNYFVDLLPFNRVAAVYGKFICADYGKRIRGI